MSGLSTDPFCKIHKRTKMVKRNGSRGSFWGCPKFPDCTHTLDIPKEHNIFKISSYPIINDLYLCTDLPSLYDCFINSEAFQYVIETINNKGNKDLVDGTNLVLNRGLESNIHQNGISGTIGWLKNKNKHFYAATWVYFLYRLNNNKVGPKWLDSSWSYWTSTYIEGLKEAEIQNTLFLNKVKLFEDILNIVIEEKEYQVNYGKIDIFGREKNNEVFCAFELKSGKHRNGYEQAVRYRNHFIRQAQKVKCYIIGSGYPEEYIDVLVPDGFTEKIGLLSYVIQDNEIVLIPWRDAEIYKSL